MIFQKKSYVEGIKNGLKNFFNIFKDLVNEWMFIENSGEPYTLIAQNSQGEEKIYTSRIWNSLKQKYYEK